MSDKLLTGAMIIVVSISFFISFNVLDSIKEIRIRIAALEAKVELIEKIR